MKKIIIILILLVAIICPSLNEINAYEITTRVIPTDNPARNKI